MNSAGEELLSQLDSNFIGTILILSDDFNKNNQYFPTLDYLFDGLLSENYASLEEGQRLNFFSTNCYGHPFFLGVVKYSETQLSSDLENVLTLAKRIDNHKNQVFLLSEDDAICGKALQIARSQFKQFSFR